MPGTEASLCVQDRMVLLDNNQVKIMHFILSIHLG